MTRHLRSAPHRAERKASRSGVTADDLMAPLQISLANVTDRVTDHAMWALATEFAAINFRCEQSDREALRKTIRTIVNQKVLDALRHEMPNEMTEPDIIARLRVTTTTRETLVEPLEKPRR